jgi:fructose-1,6-bisphosphatase/inositol monophosphatase family enzyme
MSDSFADRLQRFAGKGELCAFNLAAVAEGLDIVSKLAEQNAGAEVVEERIGDFKNWDPEILKVDRDVENRFIELLGTLGRPVVMLSEEIGRKVINPDAAGQKLYCVSDPFDGSYLFKRGIPDFWYSSMALYDEQLLPLCCAVGDGVQRKIAFATDKGAFIADLDGGQLKHEFKLDADYRQRMGRTCPEDLTKASIESYAMKPKKFLFPVVDQYRELMAPFRFFLPNGGPYGFVDVAEGKIDCYFAPKQPFVDIFSGIYVGQQAGIVVTDFDGNPVTCRDDHETVHDIVASGTPAVHEQVLELIARCRKSQA